MARNARTLPAHAAVHQPAADARGGLQALERPCRAGRAPRARARARTSRCVLLAAATADAACCCSTICRASSCCSCIARATAAPGARVSEGLARVTQRHASLLLTKKPQGSQASVQTRGQELADTQPHEWMPWCMPTGTYALPIGSSVVRLVHCTPYGASACQRNASSWSSAHLGA